MEITVTEAAQIQIESQLKQNHLHTLKLVYDNEGCGCAVNGVPQLMMAPQTEEWGNWASAEGTSIPIIYAKKDAIYFEERLAIDYNPSTHAFMLKSNNQIYNANLSLIAPTKQTTGGY
jgi:uncharacterized protein YqkB